MSRRSSLFGLSVLAAACGGGGKGDSDAAPVCEFPLAFEEGSATGHPAPLGAGPGEARAGRVAAADLPADPLGLAVWAPGDFVLANDRVAVLIEDVGPSDLYDPWGGRPVGIARVEGGRLVDPTDFGEILILTGRNSIVTTKVTVLNDGSDGNPAVVRAAGLPAPTPFTENILAGLFREEYHDVPAAIDYVLAPDSDVLDVYVHYNSPRVLPAEQPVKMHAFMFTPRLRTWVSGRGFGIEGGSFSYLGFVDDDGMSYAYSVPGESLDWGISVSGFVSVFEGDGFTIAPCARTTRHYARLTIGGPGVDGLVQALARQEGATLRAISGFVVDSNGEPQAGVRVHAEDAATDDYLTRATTDATGAYTLHVPAATPVLLTAWRRGDAVGEPVLVAGDATSATPLVLPAAGAIHVTTVDGAGAPVPARVQILPAGASVLPTVPASFGEPETTGGRLHVAFPKNGEVTLRVPAGEWEVVVSRGYEYELDRRTVTVGDGETVDVAAQLLRSVDTAGAQCGDFHIHTHRSNDSGDDARLKVLSAAADGLEIPVRSEHEYVASFQPLIEELGLGAFGHGVGSIELTSMEIWGHMGVVPLEADPGQVNAGAPLWQRYPSAEDPDALVETLPPPVVFAAVRQRPEQPTIIINHPRGGANYFDYVGYDRKTGLPEDPGSWDEEFTVVEVFNDSGWLANRDGTVADWLSLLDHGRRVFAVGSSDSHGIKSSPVGYPRTCMRLGTDDPRQVTPSGVRDAIAAGHGAISGGIYVDAWVGAAGPGDDATALGPVAQLRVRVQAATWVDVDFLDVVVDGQTVDTIAITPADADPENPAVRFDQTLPIDVSPAGGYVIVAAYGDAPLDPVHPGRVPFGVTNPIFLAR